MKKKSQVADEKIEIRDARNKAMYRVDDAYLNGYARLCGVYSTAVYNSLCRHSDNHQKSFPSIELMSEQHGVDRKTIMRAVDILEQWGIVRVIRSKDEHTKRQKPNVYILVDKSLWKQKPSPSQVLGAESLWGTDPSPSGSESRVPPRDCKDTHIKEAQIKDTAETSSATSDFKEENKTISKLDTLIDVSIFDFDKELGILLGSDDIAIKIIGSFMDRKKMKCTSKKEMRAVKDRHIRVARKLANFETDKLTKAFDYCEKKYTDIPWVLDTVFKVITSQKL